MAVERADVARWLGDYVEAWKTYDRDRIATLFSEDCVYRYRPTGDEAHGRDGEGRCAEFTEFFMERRK